MSANKIPRYKVIENDILDKINTNYYKISDMIPTEIELSKKYNVSRVTVRKATDSLVTKGLLTRTPGLGTFVKNNVATQKTTSQTSFTEDMQTLGMTCHSLVNNFCLKQADGHISSVLGININEPVYYIERSRYGNDDILMFEITYISVNKYPDLSIQILEKSKFDYFEKIKNLKIDYSIHHTIPVLPTQQLIKLFHIDANTPIIKISNTTYLEGGEVMDFTEQYMNSPKYQLNYMRKR